MMSPDIVGGDLGNPQSLNRYAYVLNNPLSLIDPSGFEPQQVVRLCEQGTTNENKGPCTGTSAGGGDSGLVDVLPLDTEGQAFGGKDCGMCDDEPAGSGAGSGIGMTQTGLDIAGMVPGPVGMIANVASAGISAYNGNWGAAALSIAFATPFVGQFGAEIHGAVEVEQVGYRSFKAFKAAQGAAEEGMQWHHIVEQTPGNLARFGPGAIHNVENLVQVPKDLHIGEGSISAYYSSKQGFTNGLTVRKWLAPQSLDFQRDFGLNILRDYGVIR